MTGHVPSGRTFSSALRLLLLLPAVAGLCVLAETNAPPGAVEAPGAPAASADEAVSELPPVVVSASPTPNSLFDLAQPVTVLEGEHLRNRLAPTLGETLGREPGIHSTYYGPNASRPVIRGLDGDHIRLLQNGVGTMDVSATSVDHAVSQDPLTMTRIEVVRGAAALLYGPTAVGGVVNVMDNRIPDTRIDEPLTGRVEGRYSSPDNGTSGALLIEGGQDGFNFHIDGFARDSDDVGIPGFARSARLQAADPLPPGGVEARDELPNSQAHSEGGTAGLSYVWEQGYAGAAFQAYNSSYGTVAEPDVTIRLKQRRWDVAGAFNDPVAFLQSLKWKLGLSDYEHTEFEGSTPGTIFEQDALNARVEALHKPVGNIVGAVGYEARRDDLMVTGAEAFLPPSVTLVNSAFIFEEVDWETLQLQFGGRLDNSQLDSSTDPNFGPGLSRCFTTGSGAAGLVYRPGEMYSGALNFAYTQRAPVNQELFANGPHLATGTFEVGNPGLRPEESFGVDLSLRKETGKVTGSATVFYTHFNNFITLIPRGVNDPVDNLPIFDFTGIPADFLGVEASVIFHLIEERDSRMHLELKTDFVHATNTDTSDPLPRIPHWRFGAELEYGWNERFSATVTLLRAQSQDRTAPNELATDGYVMLDVAFTCRLATGAVAWDLLVKGSNLFNEEARLHTSFLKDIAPLAGRGALVALRASYQAVENLTVGSETKFCAGASVKPCVEPPRPSRTS